MIDQSNIRHQASRRYLEYLSLLADGGEVPAFFPVELRFAKVKSGEAVARWSDLRGELLSLREASSESGAASYSIEWEERNDRLAGTQRFPVSIYFPDADSLLGYLGKIREATRFQQDFGRIVAAFPELRAWVAAKPRLVVDHAGDWDRLLAVIRWFRDHPHPGIFAREIPAVEDTKFIERKRGVLRELLDLVLPAAAVNRGTGDFDGRFGLRNVEPLVRIAVLDTEVAHTRFAGLRDISVPVSAVDRVLVPELTTIIVFENKSSFSNADAFLSLPAMAGCAAIFGSGFAAGALCAVTALAGRNLFYWGDIDTHGLRILSLVRARFPACRSVLMDEETFERYPEFRTDAPPDRAFRTPCLGDVSRNDPAGVPCALTEEEQILYRRLAALSKANRLEQERIPVAWAREKLLDCLAPR